MRIRIRLKQEYTYPSNDPKKPNKTDCGFVHTSLKLKIGQQVTFEDLNPQSNGGDLNTEHYKYFRGKVFKMVFSDIDSVFVELLEV